MEPVQRRVYDFAEGSGSMRDLLGGKGANLAAMTGLGLPVPPGFTITTAACMEFLGTGGTMPAGLEREIAEHVAGLEARSGRRLGDADDPLLVSVRSGARFSMPGMMDTILNLGLNEASVVGLATRTGNRRFALDAYRRLIHMFGEVVSGVEKGSFEHAMADLKERRGAAADVDLDADDLRELVDAYLDIHARGAGAPFPQDPLDQLEAAVAAVFRSWEGRRARDYRRVNGIPDDLGTAVNVQQMVFGNTGPRSATGVAFTRDNVTGDPARPFGEFLVNAQGEDVVAGIRTPRPLAELEDEQPEAYARLLETMRLLERSQRDMQDVEFTIEDGTLFMLQTRAGKRSAHAMVRIAVDMVDEGIVDARESLATLVDPRQVRGLLIPQVDRSSAPEPLAGGVAASPGGAIGAIVLSADEAKRRGDAGEPVILVTDETTPDDFHGMAAARGILTARGGKTSHAAVVAVGMGRPAVCGAAGVRFPRAGGVEIGGRAFAEGDVITIDGSEGQVYAGEVALLDADPDNPYLERILGWADDARTLGVRANADTPEAAREALRHGAEGIGLCRTEHMFGGARAATAERMILADDVDERRRELDALREWQEDDFREMFRTMGARPVTIRLLDPPLHEFLPDVLPLAIRVAAARERGDADPGDEELLARVRALSEANPMLGTRGCRLGIVLPEIYRMQVAAVMRAACDVLAEEGAAPHVEIMIPLVGFAEELRVMRREVEDVAEAALAERGADLGYRVGTMIELPRACVTAGEIAQHADFFSFGTNDLTQTTLGFSRDDAETGFMVHYLREGILRSDPFATIDRAGVGELVRMAVGRAREARPSITLGVCGEHGGDPDSVTFFHEAGLDYVSCSPFRVRAARIAAGRAALGAS